MNWWHEQFNDELKKKAAEIYQVAPSSITRLGGFENLIYHLELPGERSVLRVSHSSHRSLEQFQAELNWIYYLAECGVSISKPLRSPSGNLLETIQTNDGAYVLTAFLKAEGSQPSEGHPEWNEQLFRAWGKLIGQMHKAAKHYEVPNGEPVRTFTEAVPEECLTHPPEDVAKAMLERFNEVERQINEMPRHTDSFGLCHRDLHQGNFFVHEGKITAFDFDDCGYDYFIQDIAMALYYAANFMSWRSPLSDPAQLNAFGKHFLTHFMAGYEEENVLDRYWLEQLPVFMEKRRIDLCFILYKNYSDPARSNAEQQEWLRVNVQGVLEGKYCMELSEILPH